jgi:hypothetical protein
MQISLFLDYEMSHASDKTGEDEAARSVTSKNTRR